MLEPFGHLGIGDRFTSPMHGKDQLIKIGQSFDRFDNEYNAVWIEGPFAGRRLFVDKSDVVESVKIEIVP